MQHDIPSQSKMKQSTFPRRARLVSSVAFFTAQCTRESFSITMAVHEQVLDWRNV